MGPETTRSVPPVVVDGARTPVTPASGFPPWTGTSTVPLAPPLQLTASTTTRTTTTRPPSNRCPDRPRAQLGTRSRTLPTATPPAAPAAGCSRRWSAVLCRDPADRCELVGVQAGTADEGPVDVGAGEDPGDGAGLHRSPVEDTDDVGGLRSVALGEPRAQRPADLLRILRRGHLAGADRPHRLVGEDDLPDLLRGQALQGRVELVAAVGHVPGRQPLGQPLPHAQDRGQAVPERGLQLAGHQGVVLAVDRAPLRVSDDDVRAGHRGEHGPADVAGVRAGVVRREVLGAVADRQLVAGDERLNAAQRGERRQHDRFGPVEDLLRHREDDLLHQPDGLEVGQVHLPVAGDQPTARHQPSRTVRPGSCRPSRYSSDAPPPVLMCWNADSSSPSWRTAAAESPPPTTESPSTCDTASATPRVPAANGASSNTPIGPFQNTVSEPASSRANSSTVRGPTSRPSWSAGIDAASTVVVGASALNSGAQTTSTGSTIRSPASSSSRRQVSTWSASSSDLPTSWPWALRKVKHMPPPTSSVSTLGSNASITASLSLTLEPPSTTT